MSTQHTTSSSRILAAVLLSTLAFGCGGGGAPASSTSPTAPGAPAPSNPVSPDPSAPTPSAPTPAPAPAPQPEGSPHATHHHCGWIGADTAAAGTAAFVANADYFDAIHPKWFTLNPDGTPRSIAVTDDATVTSTARAHHVALIPLIDFDDAAYLRGVLATPAGITAHAQALAALVEQHGYDGLELDYEHLWSASDRAPFLALVAQTAAALHARAKQLTLALPAMDHDDGNNAYDYAALQSQADALHLMAYDFHYLGGDHLGPLAPKGWVAAITARVQSLGSPGKFILALANYGIGPGWYGSAGEVIAACAPGSYSTVTDHMTSCAYGPREAGIAPHCETSHGTVWFEDAASIAEKSALGKSAGFGGIGYWTLGGEAPGFFDAVKASYP